MQYPLKIAVVSKPTGHICTFAIMLKKYDITLTALTSVYTENAKLDTPEMDYVLPRGPLEYCCTHARPKVFKTYPGGDLPALEKTPPKQEFWSILHPLLPPK